MLEPSSEDISHLLMVLFPHTSLSGLKSPPGWALLISNTSRRCSRSPQAQAGSREGNSRALWVTATPQGWFPPQVKIKPGLGVPKQNQSWAWQGQTWPRHTVLWWQEGDKGTPNTEWLHQIYCCSCRLAGDTLTVPCAWPAEILSLSTCPSVHPSITSYY